MPMSDVQILSKLLGLPNMQAVQYKILDSERIEVSVVSTLEAAVCPICHQVSTQVHDTAQPQTLRDLAMWQRQCWLRYAPRRFRCATCQNTFVERVAWREPGYAHTERYAQHIYQRAQHQAVAQIARDEGLSQDVVRDIFERWAKKVSRSAATPT
jgi:transposase